jgi:cytochrome P450
LSADFPLGASLTLEELKRDPYPAYRRLREREPISWAPALGMWLATRYDDVRAILLDADRFTTVSADSLIQRTFGEQMLTAEGDRHRRYRRTPQAAFMKSPVWETLQTPIRGLALALASGVAQAGRAELRHGFAARLPVQAMLLAVGLPSALEPRMRGWYDSFERALSNFTHDPAVEAEAARAVSELREAIDAALAESPKDSRPAALIERFQDAGNEDRLTDLEINRNLLIILFGGISTVEALILNSLWALLGHPEVMLAVRRDLGLIPGLIEETMRWLSPVQSATRHVVADTRYAGVALPAGAIVNCMLAAANHDSSVFPDPERFDLNRPNARKHLGFAIGPHGCVGLHLAKLEARIALETLIGVLPEFRLDAAFSSPPEGNEFRQPRKLQVVWG